MSLEAAVDLAGILVCVGVIFAIGLVALSRAHAPLLGNPQCGHTPLPIPPEPVRPRIDASDIDEALRQYREIALATFEPDHPMFTPAHALFDIDHPPFRRMQVIDRRDLLAEFAMAVEVDPYVWHDVPTMVDDDAYLIIRRAREATR